MNELEIILRQEISRGGAISWARFMEVSLYEPGHGFYERIENLPGKHSHFYTSVSVGSLFGRLLAWKFAQWLKGSTEKMIVEAGAGQGFLARDILAALEKIDPSLGGEIQYHILEPSPILRRHQQETLRPFSRLRWHQNWDTLPKVSGIIFSNELLDAFPISRLVWNAAGQRWDEWHVTLQGEKFAWARKPASRNPGLPPELEKALPDGFALEVNRRAVDWWQSAARKLASGRLMTLDYGGKRQEFLRPEKKDGTLRAFHRHHQVDLLAHPGESDLTSDVDFDALIEAGEAAGLSTELFQTQEIFFSQLLREMGEAAEWTAADKRQFKTLTHPDLLGRRFQVLVQSLCRT